MAMTKAPNGAWTGWVGEKLMDLFVIARPSPNRGVLGQACGALALRAKRDGPKAHYNLSTKTEKPEIPTSLTKPIGLAPRNDGYLISGR